MVVDASDGGVGVVVSSNVRLVVDAALLLHVVVLAEFFLDIVGAVFASTSILPCLFAGGTTGCTSLIQ